MHLAGIQGSSRVIRFDLRSCNTSRNLSNLVAAAYSSGPFFMAYKKSTGKAKAKKMTVAEKYAELKRQTEAAGMTVREVGGRLVVSRKKAAK